MPTIDQKRLIRQLISRPAFQPLWSGLLKLCHAGMNYGGGQSVGDSGEMEAMAFAMRSVKGSAPLVLFDVGANGGDYLQAAFAVLGKDVRAYSFEPQSSSFQELQSHFGDDSRAVLIHAALGKEIGTANLFFSVDGASTASLHQGATPIEAQSESVMITTIDHVCREQGVDRIDLLKIDTEGHEMEVLFGAHEMLKASRIRSIQFEFGDTFVPTNYHFRDIFDLLSPQYRIYRILRHGLFEITHYSHDLEVYKLSNFMCLLKSPVS
jgi:FkbM family methyltransferase